MEKNFTTIVAIDFDGTITTKDTFLEFIKYAKGKKRFYWGIFLHIHLLIAFKLRFYPNWKAKQKLFSFFFKGYKLDDFNNLCKTFHKEKGNNLMRPSIIKMTNKYIKQNYEVLIISASIKNWVLPFARALGINHVLCTEIEVTSDGTLTGNFTTKNCYGKEKVNRLLDFFPNRHNYNLIAYGDSRGDKELLEFADIQYYKPV